MKVLHVVPTYLPARRYGGTIYSVHGLCRALARRGHELHVFTTSVDGGVNSAVPHDRPVVLDGVHVWYFRSSVLRRLYFSRSMMRGLQAMVPGVNLVHLHSVFLWPTFAAALVARRDHVPYVLSPRGMLVHSLIEQKSRLAKAIWIALFERRNLEQASAIHLTSETERRELLRFAFNLPETFVVPNGADVPIEADERQSCSSLVDPTVVLFLGRLSWKKGIDRLIDAMRDVPKARLEIAGNDDEGLLPALRKQAHEAGLANRVSFLGFVDGEEKDALLRRAALLVLPSKSENFGNVVLEAMAVGCPVVVNREVGLAESVERAGAGIVCPGDPATLASAIRSLLDSADRRRACGRAGKLLVRSEYSWDTVAVAIEAKYQALIGADVGGVRA